MLRSRIAAVGLSLVVLVGAGACSSDKKDAAKDAVSSAQDSGSNDAASAAAAGALGVSKDCLQAAAAWTKVLAESGALMGSGATEQQISDMQSSLDEVGAKVPSELKGDFDTVAKAYKEYATAISGVDMTDPASLSDPATMAKVEEAGKALDTEEVKTANQRISDYFDNCK